MNKLNKILREFINRRNEKKLKNTTFSLIASNCNGAFICHDLNMKFNSPFVNLWMYPGDFIKYLKNIRHYMECDLKFIKKNGISYPVGLLDDIEIYFQHYKSENEAKIKWNERTERIQLDNLFVLMTDRDGCTLEDLKEFDRLPYKNKVVFTHLPYNNILSSFYIKGFENKESVGMCFEYVNKYTGKKRYDAFNYVKWFNGKL